MSDYVDGFVLSIPTGMLETYKEMAAKAAVIWKDCGALEYRECMGDDLNVEGEDQLSFPGMAGTKADETVIFAYAVFDSRKDRDIANEKIMADPRMTEIMEAAQAVFDCKRMAFGGFQCIVQK